MSESFETRVRLLSLAYSQTSGSSAAFKPTSRTWIEPGKKIFEKLGQSGRQVLIKEQLHAAGTVMSLRSRSAAKVIHALKSSRVRSGKSLRISSSVISEARYSRTSYTVIRNPRTQGFPPRLFGSIVM